MKPVTKIQIALFSGAILLIVLLLFANTTLPSKAEQAKQSEHANQSVSSITSMVDELKTTLTSEQKQKVDELETELNTTSDKLVALQKIANYWSTDLKQPVASAYYFEQLASTSPNEQNWLNAANRYFASVQFTNEHNKSVLVNKAVECFEKALEINPSNVDTKISLAACYVEGPEPMKGIGMMREIEKTDSNNVNLQLNFAFFSQRSGQYDKAAKRFEKVLALQPDYIEIYLHLAGAYEKAGNKAKAIENLEKYISLVDDNTVKNEIKNYINKLKNS